MLAMERFHITVPASTANLGPGFDSVGMALGKYLELTVEPAEKWSFVPLTQEVALIPQGTDNMMYEVAKHVADKFDVSLPSACVEVKSNIPLARGLGSSASAIIAGIELANQLCELNLSNEEKIRIASLLEGHPDNVAPTVNGGIVVGCHTEAKTYTVSIVPKDVDVVVVIPNYELKTDDARNALPSQFSFKGAVEASAVSNVLTGALLIEDWKTVGEMMEQDSFHEPYREQFVPELSFVRRKAKEFGAFGTALSGAGPTVLCLVEKGRGEELAAALAPSLTHCLVESIQIDVKGVSVETVTNEHA
jgi:homoserine kinase